MLRLCLVLTITGSLHAAPCDSLRALQLPHTTIQSAERHTGRFEGIAEDLPDFCRVTGAIKPTPQSDIRFEAWLPSEGWNGKFLGLGNGGYAGAISYRPMAGAVAAHYATASTDTGHTAKPGVDASWALRQPEKIVDFGYRAIHETATKAKAIASAYYGSAPKRSYFSSCSNGGRQALMEAQRYPEDYDGIVAGAPANFWTHLLTTAVQNSKIMLSEPASYIPAAKLPAIENAALSVCDGAVKDKVIDDWRRCVFKPEVLLCKGPETDACLTATQIATLKAIYRGPEPFFEGYSPGGEAELGGWAAWITGPDREKSLMFAFGTQFFKYMVYRDPAWDYRTFDLNRDMKAADTKMAKVLNSTDRDLSAFKKRGGKLILYHGWSDAAIPAWSTVDYYDGVRLKMGGAATDEFVRLFMVPGMQHCGGGPGPNQFGQASASNGDASHNIAAALEAWVEQGAAPSTIIATRQDESGYTYPLCAYPKIAQWSGKGSTKEAANYSCVTPPE